MKPRQTMKNYHNSNVPPYQHQTNLSTASALRDLELANTGFSLDEMPNIQAPNSTNLSNQDEIVKCLQAIYGKSSAEILQKLPIQAVSPPDYQRVGGGGGSLVNNIIAGSSGSGLSINSSNSHNSIQQQQPQQQKQEVQYANNQQQQQQQQHQAPAMNHFRLPTTSVHSPQQQLSQKSVLSLHQHHQNDSSNRRLNHHHLSTSNASFANLSAVSASTSNASAASNTSSSSDLNSLGALSSNIGKGPCSASAPHNLPNVIDTLGTMDNMFYDSPLQINKEPPTNHQSLIRHQQLQKLLKANNNNNQHQLRTASSPSTTLSHRSDHQHQRVNNTSSNMSQSQYPMSSQPPTSSPLQATFTTVPKSLLNLAACSSSSPSTNSSALPSASKFSSMVNQLNLRSSRANAAATNQVNLNSTATINNNNINSNNNINNNQAASCKSFNRKLTDMGSSSMNEADVSIQKLSACDQGNLLQHMTRSATSIVPNTNSTPSSKTKQIQWSLLSDDQTPMSSRSSNPPKASPGGLSQKVASNPRKPPQALSPKEAFLANLQERAARAGLSIGEISKSTSNLNATSNKNFANGGMLPPVQNTVSISPNQSKDFVNSVDRREIESALSRVEARNDLSLLYPPMLLASSSQKQINAFSAGIDCAEESDVFTKEVKRIILEECNIIYECKECNNLFRSLANLVRHKREFCTDHVAERNSMEIHKRSQINTILPAEQQTISSNSSVTFVGEAQQSSADDQEQNSIGPDSRMEDSQHTGMNNSQRISERSTSAAAASIGNGEKMIQLLKDLEARKILHEREGPKTRSSRGSNFCAQTNLSKILQSQPKNRLPSIKDSTLLGALNMNPTSTTEVHSNNSLSAFESDKNSNCSSGDVHEQLVRNSSLAKTLLNEQVKVNNSRQSLIELSKVLSTEAVGAPRQTKRVAPKRKFLEDCIQKVKRDKLLPEEEEVCTDMSGPKNAATAKSSSIQQANREPAPLTVESDMNEEASKFNSSRDSDMDSDMLMIDLDEPKKISPLRRGKRRGSTAASSTASSSSSTTKMNSTSALLKALTRPVDSKKTTDNNLLPSLDETSPDIVPVEQSTEQKPDEVSEEEEAKKNEARAQSPLFNKYTCDICDVSYDDLASLMDHTVETHKLEKMVYPCIFCSFSFIALENVCRHIIDIHKKPKAQVHRLKDVVKSRAHITSDFLACVDHPPLNVSDKDLKPAKGHSDDIGDVIDVVKDGLSERSLNQEPMIEESPAQVKVTCDSVDVESDNDEPHDLESISESGSSDEEDNDENSDDAEDDDDNDNGGDDGDDDDVGEDGEEEDEEETLRVDVDADLGPVDTKIDVASSSEEDEDDEEEGEKVPSDIRSKELVAGEASSDDNDDVDDEDDDDDGEDDDDDDDDEDDDDEAPQRAESDVGNRESNSEEVGVDEDAEDEEEEEGNTFRVDGDIGPTVKTSHKSEEQSSSSGSDSESSSSSSDNKSQKSHKSTPTSNAPSEPNPSSSQASGSGGIMKLKIQLKTRPDEKSKVYEIV